jgi:hypothetical protein
MSRRIFGSDDLEQLYCFHDNHEGFIVVCDISPDSKTHLQAMSFDQYPRFYLNSCRPNFFNHCVVTMPLDVDSHFALGSKDEHVRIYALEENELIFEAKV